MATFVEAMGWFLIVCGVATFFVPMIIRIPDPAPIPASKALWKRVRDAVTLIAFGLLTLFFPVRVHVLAFAGIVIAGRLLQGVRKAR